MSINAADVRCPKCGGPVWDERPNKKNPRGPDFRCKDKTCLDEKGYKTSIWERDLLKNAEPYKQHAVQPHPTGAKKEAFSSGPHIPAMDDEHPALPHEKLDQIFRTYSICFKQAHKEATGVFGPDVADTTVAAMSATLLIAAQKAGVC